MSSDVSSDNLRLDIRKLTRELGFNFDKVAENINKKIDSGIYQGVMKFSFI
jgi:hypothetical protein